MNSPRTALRHIRARVASQRMSCSELIDTFADVTPDKAAVFFRDRATTFSELAAASELSARRLQHCGVGTGDRVAIFMRNRTEFVELYLACFRIGAVAVPINHRFATAEVLFAVTHCAARLLIVDGPLLPVVDGLDAQAPSLTGLYGYGDAPIDGPIPDWASAPAAAGDAWPIVDDAAPAMILYTSGSTGKPKGVTHTHDSIMDTARGRIATQQLTADDVALAATAICHGGGSIGVTFPTLLAGGSVVLLEESEPELLLQALARHRPTRTLLLPAQLLDALRAPGAADVDFTCLQEVECGGDQVSPELYTEFAKVTELELNQAYGLTECEGVAMNPPFGEIRRGSIGRPRQGVEVRLAAGHTAHGDSGEIQIRSRSVMARYWDDPEHTAAAFADGWLCTGDLAHRDADGYLWFDGRIKELIIRGGSNIAPGEVEDVLNAHPDVELSCVVGLPDERLGALSHAFVQFHPGLARRPDVTELTAFARSKLAAYKVPDRWSFPDALPRNAVGKIDRHALHVRAQELDG